MSKPVKILLALLNTVLVAVFTLFIDLINAELGTSNNSVFANDVYPVIVLGIALLSIGTGWYRVFRTAPANFTLKIFLLLPYLLILVILGAGFIGSYA